MANKVFTLSAKIDVDNANAKKQIKEVTDDGQELSNNFAENLGKIGKTAVAIGGTVAATATVLFMGFKSTADSAAETADAIDKGAARMGIGTKTYQELSYAAGQCGVEMSILEQAAKKLEGIDLNMEDAMNQIMSLGTAEERASKAAELFGNEIAYTMNPLLQQSSEEYGALIQNANDLNLIIGEDAINAGVKYGDTISDISQSFDAMKNGIVSSFLPIIQKLLDLVIQNMPKIQSLFDKLSPVLEELLEVIVPLVADLAVQILPPILDIIIALMPFITSLIDNIMPVFNEILQLIMPLLVDLVQIVMPLLTPFLDLISALLMPILEVLEPIFALLEPFIDLIVSLANIIGAILKPAINIIASALTAMFDKWKEVFGAILEVAKKPINGVIDVINGLIGGLNKIKLPDWSILGKAAGKGINIPLIKKLKVGLEYVPYDEMPAILHKGEQVLTSDEAKEYRENKNKINEVNNNYYNTINVEHLEVRDEMDIQRISEELYYLQKKAEV